MQLPSQGPCVLWVDEDGFRRFNDSLVKAGTGDDSAKDGEAGGDMIVLERKEALAAEEEIKQTHRIDTAISADLASS